MISASMIPELAETPQLPHRFATDDLDEIREIQTRFGSQRREVRGRGPLGWDARMAAFRGVTFGWTTIGLPQVLHVLPAFDLFHVPIESPVVYESQGRRSGADPECGVLLRASVPYTSVHSAGRAFAFALSGGLIARELESRTRPDGEAGMRSAIEIPLVGAVREGLRSIVRELNALIPSLDDPSAASGPAITEARIIDWTADRIASGSPDHGALDPGEARMRVVEEWIEENLEQPITLGTLCDIAGVCARSLQIGFQRRRGQSPLRYVTRRRLLRARLRLSNADPSTSVTEIALSSGFSHFGRFSVLYRKTFGVTPSATRQEPHGVTGPAASDLSVGQVPPGRRWRRPNFPLEK